MMRTLIKETIRKTDDHYNLTCEKKYRLIKPIILTCEREYMHIIVSEGFQGNDPDRPITQVFFATGHDDAFHGDITACEVVGEHNMRRSLDWFDRWYEEYLYSTCGQ